MAKYKVNTKDIFYFAYAIHLLFTLIETSLYAIYVSPVLRFVHLLTMLLLLVDFVLQKKITAYSLLLSVCLAALMVIGFSVGKRTIVYILAFVIGGRGKDFKRIAKITIRLSFIVLICVILSSYLGIIKDYISYRGVGNIARHYLGFRYVLYGPAIFLNVLMLILCVKKGKVKPMYMILLISMSYILFRLTDARLSFYLSMLTVFASIILSKVPNIFEKSKLITFILCGTFIVFAALSLYCTIFYNSGVGWMSSLNTLLGKRLSIGQMSFARYGVSLFGQRIEMEGWGLGITGEVNVKEYSYVDNLYVQVLINYGVVFFIAYLGLFTATLVTCAKKKKWWYFLMLLLISVHNIVDDNGLSLAYCTFWFIISEVMLGTRSKKLNNRDTPY